MNHLCHLSKMVGHNDFIVTLSVDPKAISSLVSQQEDKVDLKAQVIFVI